MTTDVELIEIMRAMANGERNALGDYWHGSEWCNVAADRLEELTNNQDDNSQPMEFE